MGRQHTGQGRRLIAGLTLVAVVTTVAYASSAVPARAQGFPPSIPASIFGAVLVDGAPPPDGTAITARIGDTDCTQEGKNHTFMEGETAVYAITVAHSTQIEGCGSDGATITFYIDGEKANQTATWKAGLQEVGLSIGSQAPPPLPTATPGGPGPDATPVEPTAAAATATAQAMFTPLPAPSSLPTDEAIFPTNEAGTPEAPGTATNGDGATGTPSPGSGDGNGSGNGDSGSGDDDDGGSAAGPIAAGVVAVLAVGAGAGLLVARRRKATPGDTNDPDDDLPDV